MVEDACSPGPAIEYGPSVGASFPRGRLPGGRQEKSSFARSSPFGEVKGRNLPDLCGLTFFLRRCFDPGEGGMQLSRLSSSRSFLPGFSLRSPRSFRSLCFFLRHLLMFGGRWCLGFDLASATAVDAATPNSAARTRIRIALGVLVSEASIPAPYRLSS